MYYVRIDTSKWADVAKSNSSKESMICHYLFFNHGLSFKIFPCNGCHDLTILCLTIRDVAIITVKDVDYRFVIHDISKSEAINYLKNYHLDDCGYI